MVGDGGLREQRAVGRQFELMQARNPWAVTTPMQMIDTVLATGTCDVDSPTVAGSGR